MKIPFFSALLLMLGFSACVSNQPVQPSVDYSQSVNPLQEIPIRGHRLRLGWFS